VTPPILDTEENPLLEVKNLSYSYGDKAALDDVSFSVQRGEIFGLLGPNGGGKTTLFKILSTLFRVQTGDVNIMGRSVQKYSLAARSALGVVFQNPGLDRNLTVKENLKHHGHLLGMRGTELAEAIESALQRLGVTGRSNDRVDTLSGGLARRVELAKGLLNKPPLLLLDEPSTGLDPGARLDLWRYLKDLRNEQGTTVILTTHLMEEAESCDRLAIIDHGRFVATGTPQGLRSRVGERILSLRCEDPDGFAAVVSREYKVQPVIVEGRVRLENVSPETLIPRLLLDHGDKILGLSMERPTLADVFVHETGHTFWKSEQGVDPS
jgi:ABC-2 type transport system ATP-binding protein